MFEYVVLTDGTTIIELTDTIAYALVSYAPGVASLRDNEIGGEGPYADVVDSLTIQSLGCTAAECYANAEAIDSLLDQAQRWWADQNVNPVILKVKAQNSSIDPLTAIVKGRASGRTARGLLGGGGGGKANVTLPAVEQITYDRYVMQPIVIEFVRRGPFVRATAETLSIAPGANPSATVVSGNFPTNYLPPSYLSLTANNIANNYSLTTPFLFWNKTAANLQVLEGEAFFDGLSAFFTVVADAGNQARGGNILRFAGSTSLSLFIRQQGLAAVTTSCKRAVVYAAVRSNVNTMTFGIQIAAYSKTGAAFNNDPSYATTYWQATTANNPEIIPIGIVFNRNTIGALDIACSSPGTITTERLDIDYLILCGIDDEQSGVIGFPTFALTNVYSAAPVTDLKAIDVLFNPTSDVVARVRLRNTTGGAIAGLSYIGDPIAQHSGQNISLCFVCCRANFWRLYNSSTAALMNIGFDLTRYLTDRVPS